jgi:glucosylceramidase
MALIALGATACGHGHSAAPSPITSATSTALAPTTPAAPAPPAAVRVWLTTADGTRKLVQQTSLKPTASGPTPASTVQVNDSRQFQQFWGVGASITGASAQLVNGLPAAARQQVMTALFSRDGGIGLAVLRQPLGANDFSIGRSSYDDLPGGASDPTLSHFGLGKDATDILPLVRRAEQLNPNSTVLLTPWSAPAWMKTGGSLIGGSLAATSETVYAQYLARTVQAYASSGIRVGGLTLQNEPSFTPTSYPGMYLSAAQQQRLIPQVAAALSATGQSAVGVWALDDNYDRVADAQQIVSDPVARAHLAGVAFHCYRGQTSQMAAFHRQNPAIPLAVSECTGGDWSPNFADNLRYDTESLLIDGIRNGAAWVSKWNVALDPKGGPTNGGCTNCRGLLTIDPTSHAVSYDEAYYAFGQVGRFVVPGAHVVASTTGGAGGLKTVAFRNADSSHVLLALNASNSAIDFRTTQRSTQATTSFDYHLAAGAVATFTW